MKRSSSWFLFTTLALLGVLTVGITTSYLVLLRHSGQVRVGLLTGSSMEPALRGPRVELRCTQCRSLNSWTADAWDATKEVRCQFCKEYLETSESTLREGQAVVYVPSLLWRMNGQAQGASRSDSGPIRRWDMVVLDPPDGVSGQKDPSTDTASDRGQIKRIVGLPDESIAIRQGRIWANGKQVLPTPEEFMQQAVVMASWKASPTTKSLSDFMLSSSFPIDNELPINAQDSHLRIAVQDIGIAFRLSKPERNWNLKISLRHGSKYLPIDLSCYEQSAQVGLAQSEGTPLQFETIHRWSPVWICLVVLGDRLVVLDEKEPRCTIQLDPLEEGLGWKELRLIEPEGLIDRCILFRGLHFRGVRDTNEQEFQAAGGWIVLGDNVSISEDSRYWGAGRVETAKIRGVIKHHPALMEGLVKQLP